MSDSSLSGSAERTTNNPTAKFSRIFDLLSLRDPTLNATLYEDAEFAGLSRDIYAALAEPMCDAFGHANDCKSDTARLDALDNTCGAVNYAGPGRRLFRWMVELAGETNKRPSIRDAIDALREPTPSRVSPSVAPEWLNPKELAHDAVQRLADSEPTEDSIEGMERLRGTPQESMFVVNAAELVRVIECTLEDAIYDASRFPSSPAPSSESEEELGKLLDALISKAIFRGRDGYGGARLINGSYEERQKAVDDARSAVESYVSRLRDERLTPEEAGILIAIIEATPMKYPPEITVLYKRLRLLSTSDSEQK